MGVCQCQCPQVDKADTRLLHTDNFCQVAATTTTGTPWRPAPAVSHPSQTSGEGTEEVAPALGTGQGDGSLVWVRAATGQERVCCGVEIRAGQCLVSSVQHRDNTLTECYHIPQVTYDSPPLGGHCVHTLAAWLVIDSNSIQYWLWSVCQRRPDY